MGMRKPIRIAILLINIILCLVICVAAGTMYWATNSQGNFTVNVGLIKNQIKYETLSNTNKNDGNWMSSGIAAVVILALGKAFELPLK